MESAFAASAVVRVAGIGATISSCTGLRADALGPPPPPPPLPRHEPRRKRLPLLDQLVGIHEGAGILRNRPRLSSWRRRRYARRTTVASASGATPSQTASPRFSPEITQRTRNVPRCARLSRSYRNSRGSARRGSQRSTRFVRARLRARGSAKERAHERARGGWRSPDGLQRLRNAPRESAPKLNARGPRSPVRSAYVAGAPGNHLESRV